MTFGRLYIIASLMMASVSSSPHVLGYIGGGLGLLAIDMFYLLGFVLFTIYLFLRKTFALPYQFVFLFFLFILHVVIGAVFNQTDQGAIISGIRAYFRFLPFFLIPVVMYKDGWNVTSNKLLIAILLMQVPFAFLQRFVFYPNMDTGDVVRGTAGTGSMMAICLVCAIALVFGLYIRKEIALKRAALIALVLFVPVTIGEIKGAIVLFVIGILAIGLSGYSSRQLKNLFLLAIPFVIVFGVTYDALYSRGSERSIVDFITDPDRALRYLAPRHGGYIDHKEEGEGPFGRIDRIIAPLKEFENEPVRFFFGVGIGNTSSSRFEFLSGDFAWANDSRLVGNSVSRIIWEFGLFGLIIFISLPIMQCMYIRKCVKKFGVIRGDCIGWFAVNAIIVIALFYKDIIPSSFVMSLYFFTSGVIMSNLYADVAKKRMAALQETKISLA
ncbi:MAG: hypothetical protein AAF434_12045 [Pseudomonadota bacterium]